MGFVWEHADSFLHCVASPFHSFVTKYSERCQRLVLAQRADHVFLLSGSLALKLKLASAHKLGVRKD